MRRVFEKLRGLYQRKVMKRFAWLRFFLVMLALGSVLAVMLHQALTAVDTRSAQRAMNESFEFVKAQLVRYNSYVSADKAKSLVRLMDKTAEAARILRDEPGAGAHASRNVRSWRNTPASSGSAACSCWTSSFSPSWS